MPAKSKKQQRFMGMVRAVQKGEMKSPSKKISEAAKSMSKKDVKDYAKTKHEGLPNKVKKESNMKKTAGISWKGIKDILKAKQLRSGVKGVWGALDDVARSMKTAPEWHKLPEKAIREIERARLLGGPEAAVNTYKSIIKDPKYIKTSLLDKLKAIPETKFNTSQARQYTAGHDLMDIIKGGLKTGAAYGTPLVAVGGTVGGVVGGVAAAKNKKNKLEKESNIKKTAGFMPHSIKRLLLNKGFNPALKNIKGALKPTKSILSPEALARLHNKSRVSEMARGFSSKVAMELAALNKTAALRKEAAEFASQVSEGLLEHRDRLMDKEAGALASQIARSAIGNSPDKYDAKLSNRYSPEEIARMKEIIRNALSKDIDPDKYPGMGLGARTGMNAGMGALVGLLGGPAAPITVPLGAAVMGGAGAMKHGLSKSRFNQMGPVEREEIKNNIVNNKLRTELKRLTKQPRQETILGESISE
jgi:hypothetical protein